MLTLFLANLGDLVLGALALFIYLLPVILTRFLPLVVSWWLLWLLLVPPVKESNYAPKGSYLVYPSWPGVVLASGLALLPALFGRFSFDRGFHVVSFVIGALEIVMWSKMVRWDQDEKGVWGKRLVVTIPTVVMMHEVFNGTELIRDLIS